MCYKKIFECGIFNLVCKKGVYIFIHIFFTFIIISLSSPLVIDPVSNFYNIWFLILAEELRDNFLLPTRYSINTANCL